MDAQVPNTFAGLFWGYFAFFVILTVYILSLGKRLRRLEACGKENESKE